MILHKAHETAPEWERQLPELKRAETREIQRTSGNARARGSPHHLSTHQLRTARHSVLPFLGYKKMNLHTLTTHRHFDI